MTDGTVIWTPTYRLAWYLRRRLSKVASGEIHVVVGWEAERLRGYRVDRILIYDPLNVIPMAQIDYARTRAGSLEWLHLSDAELLKALEG